MKRSEINTIMREGQLFLEQRRFHLPGFAEWGPSDWGRKGPECRQIVEQQLGWDVTDFGSGDFPRVGLFLFTVRNGSLAEVAKGQGKTYAEKAMIVREGQVTPTHFHFLKMEDIINRGGGELLIQLWNSTTRESLDTSAVSVSVDGSEVTVPAGGTLTLKPGDSVCLPPRLYHKFWAREGAGTVLVGEVSRVNDDRTDNRFHDSIGRFPAIEEDVPPLHLLCTDYGRYYRQ